MLDLKTLEDSLDKQLASETPESLGNWLMHKRYQEYLTQVIDPVSFEVFKIIREQIEWLEGRLGTKWNGGANTLLNNQEDGLPNREV